MTSCSGISAGPGVPIVTTTETVVLVGPAVPEQNPGGQGIAIWGLLNITAGTNTNGATVRVRAGTTVSAPLVGQAQPISLAAGQTISVHYSALDPTLTTPGAQYCVTIQQNIASANGSLNYGTLFQEPCTAAVG